MNKKTLLPLICLLTLLIAFLLYKGIYKKDLAFEAKPQPSANEQTEPPQIIATKPDPLENAVVSATEVVEITFNRPLENIGEFKFRIDPKAEIKIELSPDRKTAKIIPQTPFELGVTYTIFIGPETKFDGVGNWGKEAIYHFQTIKFRGI
ncbi:Ig-like domain-containing protein [Candidatus Daviesbacteria bacterium]|nr:Ig-like domain-containing protein [Candidatus Daviesbacteria bacterium]